MNQRMGFITLAATDVQHLQKFYECLGWKPSFTEQDIVFFQLNGIVLLLVGRSNLTKNGQIQDDGATFGGTVLGYTAKSREEVDAVIQLAESAGGRILKPGEEEVWGGYAGYFADPDGHIWQVIWNPEWSISPEGMTLV